MKKLLILSMVVLCSENLSAQTWAEWFNQKATQKKYLLQQIAALHVYSGYLVKGYSIAKNGMNSIKKLQHGDVLQHTNYFTSLVSVNPQIKRYTKVAEIIALQISIAKLSSNAIKSFKSDRQVTLTELKYLIGVFNSLLDGCANSLEELLHVITNRSLQLKDDERIAAIDKIHIDVKDMHQFVNAFCNNAAGLMIQRSNESNDIIISQKINGLK